MLSLEQIKAQFEAGNSSAPATAGDEKTKVRPQSVADTPEGDTSEDVAGLADAIEYYSENNILDDVTIPTFTSSLTADTYPNATYYLDLYEKEYGCPQCTIAVYTAYCNSDGQYSGGIPVTELPPGSTRIDNLEYYSESDITTAYGPPGGETTVAPDEFWCGTGNYLVFFLEYRPLPEYATANQCANYANANPEKTINWAAGGGTTLTVTDVSGSGRLSADLMLNQLYTQYEQNYSNTHVPCTERFEEV